MKGKSDKGNNIKTPMDNPTEREYYCLAIHASHSFFNHLDNWEVKSTSTSQLRKVVAFSADCLPLSNFNLEANNKYLKY